MDAFLIPGIVFGLLVLMELWAPRVLSGPSLRLSDHVLNFSGLIMQGYVVPISGWLAVTQILQPLFPAWAGVLQIGFWGALAFNLIVVDFLYYWQHRAFHRFGFLWRFHICHHAAPRVDIWATARNSLPTHFLFVYFLLNPIFGYLCDNPSGFFAGAMITAGLDVLRHTNTNFSKLGLGRIMDLAGTVIVTPRHHHRHHANTTDMANFGANFILWDKSFGTLDSVKDYPERYGVDDPPSFWDQLFLPRKTSATTIAQEGSKK